MPTNQVVLYFDKQEDAVLFAVAARSIMSNDRTLPGGYTGST